MPTVRYEYKLEQVKARFQEFARQIATDTMNMFGKEYTGTLLFKSYGDGRIDSMEVELFSFTFYPKHVGGTFRFLGGKMLKDRIMFDVEKKVYRDTPHNTKINLLRPEDKEPVMQFLAEVMGGEKPAARFSLKQIIEVDKAESRTDYEKMLALVPRNSPITKVFLFDSALNLLKINSTDAEKYLSRMLKEKVVEKVENELIIDCYLQTERNDCIGCANLHNCDEDNPPTKRDGSCSKRVPKKKSEAQ